MSAPHPHTDTILDSYETASFIVLALRDNNLISKDDAVPLTNLLTSLRYADFLWEYDGSLYCSRTLDRKEV